jgi:DNA-binding CsgD family transcriptional regulator
MASHAVVLEREGVLADLLALYDDVDREGRMVLLTGEAGIGKTTVARRLADKVQGPTWWGQCDPLTTPRPLSPLLDIVDDASTGLPDLFSGAPEPYDVFARLVTVLRDVPEPLLLVVEDVHWADGATLDMLRFLGRRLRRCRALVLATFRDDEVTAEHPLAAIIGELERAPDVTRVRLAPLSDAAVAQLTTATGTHLDPVRLHALTGGNPFFVTEVLASGDYSSATVRDAVMARLGALDQDARRVVEAVSLDPRALETTYAIALAGADEAAAERALRSGVLLDGPAGLRFRHELARAAVAAEMPVTRRRDWHGQLLPLLLSAERVDLSRVVHHAVAADNRPVVLRHGRDAARQARRRGANREAAELLDAVLLAAEGLPPQEQLPREEQVRLRHEAADVLWLVDRQQDALRRAVEAVGMARTLDDPETLGRSLLQLARAQWLVGSTSQSRATEASAVQTLRAAAPGPTLAAALSQAASTAMLGRHHASAISLAGEAVGVAESVGDTEDQDLAMMFWGAAELVTGDADLGIAMLVDILERAEQAGNRALATRVLGMLGSGGGEARRYEEAFGWLERGIVEAYAHDLDYSAAYDRAWQARIRCEQGRWDEAAELAQVPARLPVEAAVISPMTALSAIGRIRVRRGDPGARQVLERVLTIGAGAELQHRWPALCALAELEWLAGRPERGQEVLTGPWQESLSTDSPWAQGEIGYWLWRCGGLETVPDTAAPPFRLMVRGEWRDASQAWELIGCPYEQALALMEGDTDARVSALGILDGLGARPLAQRIRVQLRDEGVAPVPRGPRPLTRGHPAGLTARQAEVHRLLAEGITYGEIASRLFISARTVEHHVSAVLAKYGVSRREDLPPPDDRIPTD